MLLTEVLQKYPEYLGTHPRSKGELPILIKFIDARQKLSVQVHPDDEYAKLYERGQLGKTEMWYVLEADKDAELIYERLQKEGGFLPFHDKTSPEIIKREFKISKAAFKRAIGRLLKEGKIKLTDSGIERI